MPSGLNIGKLAVGGVRLNLCDVSTRLPGGALGRAGQGLALQVRNVPLAQNRVPLS